METAPTDTIAGPRSSASATRSRLCSRFAAASRSCNDAAICGRPLRDLPHCRIPGPDHDLHEKGHLWETKKLFAAIAEGGRASSVAPPNAPPKPAEKQVGNAKNTLHYNGN